MKSSVQKSREKGILIVEPCLSFVNWMKILMVDNPYSRKNTVDYFKRKMVKYRRGKKFV